ncbi:hypothetical protein [Streptomyces sp. NPDC005989]|uniref:hypothetical protein n=1 Tax=Streptomyces sp. NPDC005989 TaxID=3156727 RepID=UPI0033ECF086
MNGTSPIFATGMPCDDSSTIWARRQVTTDPVPLRMIRRSRCGLSAMAQSVGYLLAAVGPVVFGLLHSLSSGWRAPLLLMVVVAVAQTVAALVAGRGTVAPAWRPGPGTAAPAAEHSASTEH